MSSRQAVIDAAIEELGMGNQAGYWTDALGKPSPTLKLAWCGVFALHCLHKAGLALNTHWILGLGFLTTPERKWLFPKTQSPQPGDIGYQDSPFQHHFIVESVETDRVHSIDGNSGTHSTVNRATHPIGHGCTYFSIGSLLGEPELPAQSRPPPPLSAHPTLAAVQHAVNNLIMTHLDGSPPALLTVDGIIGPKSHAALKWAQQVLQIPVTGEPDTATLRALGLS